MADENMNDEESIRTEQRRMWCLVRAIEVALSVQAHAPTVPTIDIMLTAEEMNEFIETGVARSHKKGAVKQ